MEVNESDTEAIFDVLAARSSNFDNSSLWTRYSEMRSAVASCCSASVVSIRSVASAMRSCISLTWDKPGAMCEFRAIGGHWISGVSWWRRSTQDALHVLVSPGS